MTPSVSSARLVGKIVNLCKKMVTLGKNGHTRKIRGHGAAINRYYIHLNATYYIAKTFQRVHLTVFDTIGQECTPRKKNVTLDEKWSHSRQKIVTL